MEEPQPPPAKKPKPFLIADDLVLSNLRQAAALCREAPAGEALPAKLRQTEELYQQFRARWENQAADLVTARAELGNLEEANAQLAHALRENQRQLEQERRHAARQQERAGQLTAILKDIHRSLFSGNIYALILKACLTITGGTRGLYLTSHDPAGTPRIRAAIDVDDYPQSPPSEFIQGLCRRVLDEDDTLVYNAAADFARLPAPVGVGERFHNCVVMPVVLRKNLDGIVIVADKLNGAFDEDDVETLLSVGDQASVAVENGQLRRELQGAYLATVGTLVDAIAARDPYTHGHSTLASRYARLTAERLNLPEEEQGVACYAALLHDVGKIGVSDGVLHKPGPLLPAERDLVRAHVRIGHDLLGNVPALATVAKAVLHHHEWFDGTGYPDGLKGEEIPLASRIVAVVDAYSAMTGKRGYREPSTPEQARAELLRCSGTQFDPRVVTTFLAVLDLPEARGVDEDDDAGCGILPGFGRMKGAGESTS